MVERFETFTVLLNRINRNIRKIKNQEMADYDLRSVHISTLYYLHLQDGLTATELCDKCDEDKATISRCLDYLEQKGFVLCEIKGQKRYKSPVTLTERGKKAGKKIAEKIDRVLQTVSTTLSEEERESFYRSLALISHQLELVAAQGEQE